MRINYEKVVTSIMFTAAFFSFYLQVKGQTTKGVYRSKFTFKLLIRDDGSSTVSTALIQPTQAFPLSGGMLKRPSCKATFPYKLESKRVEWNIQVKAVEAGGNCIETANYELKNLSELNQLLNSSNGSVKEKDGKFILNMFNPHNSLSSEQLKQPVTYTYTITVPNIKNFSQADAAKSGNTVTWTFESKNQVLEISGKISAGNNEEVSAEDKDVCDRNKDTQVLPGDYFPRAATPESIRRAQEIVKENAGSIMAAAKEFGVDPKAIAGAIFAEHSRNMTPGEILIGLGAGDLGYDSSVGIAQMNISTAIRLEEAGVINKTLVSDYPSPQNPILAPLPTGDDGTWHIRLGRLASSRENIRYAAAYIKHLGNLFPEIKDNPTILTHLYNIGEFKKGGDPRSGLRIINPIPGYDCFAADARAQYSYFESLGIR